MALKKSELYSSLWSSCDELRGGMDASQYKDYVLVLLFIKYISDKYAGQPYAPITIPSGASFKDMVALKGKSDIGDQINKKIIAPLANANKLSDLPDFNDATKLGTGKEMVDRLTNLIAIFENSALDFSKNRAEGDDILGDAYEFLMRHFATESGKSKGQFYTPAEVSRIMAQIIGIHNAKTSASTTVYDPTCGSGSLLLKVGDEAGTAVTLYGQEKDAATSGLARMNMILHNNPTALVMQGNTLSDPKFRDGDTLKMFDYVVANPPFSDKRWSTGFDPLSDVYERFKSFGTPPARQGDYAYLLHIVRSLKSTGKGACILPHGVLFRGNAEGDIRRALLRKGYLKGIIGLPPNLFYGTGIPACIVVVDKEGAETRTGTFMIDASGGFMKDGPKNRLRSMDIHKIVDVFNKRLEVPKYSRMVPLAEIEQNDFNLNLPRYIDSEPPEDLQDIGGHLLGGIPIADVDALQQYWDVCPQLRHALFKDRCPGYADLTVEKSIIKSVIDEHPEFGSFVAGMNSHFDVWRETTATTLKSLQVGCKPKEVIAALADGLLTHYSGEPLINPYDVYQQLMDYWAETMQDDCYLIAADGWKAEITRIVEKDKKGKKRDKGWICDLIPNGVIVARYFALDRATLDRLASELVVVMARLAEIEEEHGGEDGAFADLDKVTKVLVTARRDEIKNDKDSSVDTAVLNKWLALWNEEVNLKKKLKEGEAALEAKSYAKYSKLTETEIRALVIDDKWLSALDAAVHGAIERVSQQLSKRVRELAERYETPLPQLISRVAELELKTNSDLQGAMQELLTGKKRLPGFEVQNGYKHTQVGVVPQDWEITTLGAVCSMKSGEGITSASIDEFSGYPCYGGNGLRGFSTRFTHDGHYALIGRQGALCGNVLSVEGKFFASEHAIVVTPFARMDIRWLTFVLQEMRLNQYSESSAQPGLSVAKLLHLELACPPTKIEQECIAAILVDVDAAIAATEAKLAKARQIKLGMMQELLTGRIRLK
jgi:type I restriction enzyme M protein